MKTNRKKQLQSEICHYTQKNGSNPKKLQCQLSAHMLMDLNFQKPVNYIVKDLPKMMLCIAQCLSLAETETGRMEMMQHLETLQTLHSFFHSLINENLL